MAHEKRFLFNILEDFLSIEMYTNRKKSIHKKVDSLVSPFKKVTRDASLFMAEAPSALGQFQNFTKLFTKTMGAFSGTVSVASIKNQADSLKKKITPAEMAKEEVKEDEKWLLSLRIG